MLDRRIEWIAVEGTVILNVSGGMDSVAAAVYATDLLREHVEDPRVVMLYVETPLAYPENRTYLEGLAGWLGVELVVARPREGLEAIARRGWPVPWGGGRWCTYRWKLEPIAEASLRYDPPRLHVLGVRRSESRARMIEYGGGDPGRPWWYCLRYLRYCSWYWAPILDWSKEDVRRYIRERGIPRNPLWTDSDGHGSPDCMICIAYAGRRDYLRLKAEHPEAWGRLLEAYRLLRRRRPGARASRRLDLEELDSTRDPPGF